MHSRHDEFIGLDDAKRFTSNKNEVVELNMPTILALALELTAFPCDWSHALINTENYCVVN